MEYQPSFTVTYTNRGGRTFRAYVPPCWMQTGKERREQAESERQGKRAKIAFGRYWAAIQKRMVKP